MLLQGDGNKSAGPEIRFPRSGSLHSCLDNRLGFRVTAIIRIRDPVRGYKDRYSIHLLDPLWVGKTLNPKP